MTGGRRELLGATLALLLGLVATLALTWPMALHLDEAVMGGGELGGWLWRYDWHFQTLEALAASDMGPVDAWLNFVSLGRYPETGNILDVLAISYPLDRALGFPLSYNAKILVIMALNGLCAYALGRYFSGSIAGGLAASTVAVINPITLLELKASGLRQAILWWLLLYPPVLDRAMRRRTYADGIAAGVALGLVGAWYWFYGLFAGMFTAFWVLKSLVAERRHLRWAPLVRAAAGFILGVTVSAGPFVVAYLVGDSGQPTGAEDPSGATASGRPLLPEMTFFLPFPSYDTISHAPLRPQTYAENVLASINRTIGSSWSATYPFDPRLNEALPLTVVAFGLVPALNRRRAWPWLAVWLVFYLGTLGPFLRVGAGDNREVTRVAGEYVVRLPYTLMFQYVPGMSRMFAPYRLASVVVVASVALVAMGVARFPGRLWLAPLVMVATTLQPMYRWGRGAVSEGAADSRELRSPIKANRIIVPAYYTDEVDSTALSGIVELPLEQQQDLMCYYQVIHRQKVFRSWASPGAIPPFVRDKSEGGVNAARLRYLARPDVVTGDVPEAFAELSKIPETAPLVGFSLETVERWAKSANYRRIIVHERGYFLVDPVRGARLYAAAVGRLSTSLGIEPEQFGELHQGDPANPVFGVPASGDLVPWTSQPADLPPERAPTTFHMAVFELPPNPARID